MSSTLSSESTPELTKSVEDFIQLGHADEMTYANFTILAEIAGQKVDIKFPEHNVIYDYLKELKSNCVTLHLEEEDYIKYRYNPKLLAFDIYGSTELYFVILAVNGMCSFKDFNKHDIKILYKRDLINLLRTIYSAEADYIEKNRNKLKNNNLNE